MAPEFGHLRKRYSFPFVCKIFGVHEDTLKDWIRSGVRLPGGNRIRLNFVWLGPRRKEFEADEVERVYQLLNTGSPTCDASIRDMMEYEECEESREQKAA